MGKLAWMALAGALGTLLRYGLQGWVQRSAGGTFPWGTLAVNLAGCFAFGLIWALAEERLAITPEARAIALVGFLGAFTTFSTFAFETRQMLRDADWWLALANLLGQCLGGIVAVILGAALGRSM